RRWEGGAMSFLTPLYIAGALAVTLPVLFHLIRRTPRGEIPFSSLMFLTPSPPRITRRSRIEHWLLLLLRGLALVLLALAFSRPFWRQPAEANDVDAAQQRVAILVDVSASMRRGDLWTQAARAVDAAMAAAGPLDQLGVYACDETLRPIASFEDLAQTPMAQRRTIVARRLQDLAPTWAGTHLGQGLLDAVALVSDSHDETEEAGRAARRIILISDMQAGSRLNTLSDAAWPADVELQLQPLVPAERGNAGLWRLADDSEQPAAADRAKPRGGVLPLRKRELRIRVSNAADSPTEQFRLTWSDAASGSAAAEGSGDRGARSPQAGVEAYVPAGESRIVRVPLPDAKLRQPRLELSGDPQPFDNQLYIVPDDRRSLRVAYLGDDSAGDPQGLRFYLERALSADPARDVTVQEFTEFAASLEGDARTIPATTPLAVLAAAPAAGQIPALHRYVEAGGTLLVVLAAAEPALAEALGALTSAGDVQIDEAEVDDYALLGEIDFSHPLFAPMASPRFNDFTQIRFWKYRRVRLPAAAAEADETALHPIARFENGDPAVLEQRRGAGRIVAFAAGWHPADGQLARSWKFLLMLSALVNDGMSQEFRTHYLVNEPAPLPPRELLASELRATTPTGAEVMLAEADRAFAATQTPGVYAFAGARRPLQFAVNIDPLESETAPVSPETFEQLGCRLVGRQSPGADAQRLSQLRDVELEGRQRLWQWMIVAALGVLIAETWLAGRLSHRLPRQLAPQPG
ncbi:MAG TPA: BatA domain-containing protein, partial [Lacipirellulaceae bacterium]|nr:BatA domain-containing protein [Lacipirellulaceae bacterium]